VVSRWGIKVRSFRGRGKRRQQSILLLFFAVR
jgi:hypothetical protein